MKEDIALSFSKETFVSIKKENISSHYDITAKELGKGSLGVVYKGKIKGTEGPWRAIKKMSKSALKDSSMILNEIEIGIPLDNPNIVKLYEIYEYHGSIYLVCDLCEGGELFDRLDEEGGLDEKEARTIFRQMVEAVTYLHGVKICHRDLKPQNFMFLTKDSSTIKLVDFGLAVKWESSLKAELGKRGEKKIVGTPFYIAPEVIARDYDERCDIWSLGVILYTLLSAVLPFDGDSDKEVLRAIKAMKYTLDIPEMKGVSKQAKDLIAKLLTPVQQRISLQAVFDHPWMKVDIPKTNMRVSFRRMYEFSKLCKLKKLFATFVASQMSEKEVEKLSQLFRKIDLNHDGFISVEELKLALADETAWFDAKDLQNLMDSIDVDKNGRMNYTEFLASSLAQEDIFSVANITKFFKQLDKDGNGSIDRQELKALFDDHQIEHINGKSISELISRVDKDNSGSISLEQLRLAIMQ